MAISLLVMAFQLYMAKESFYIWEFLLETKAVILENM